jgi:hypothetical protein
VDGQDLYLEQVNAQNEALFKGVWEPLTVVTETIVVRDTAPVTLAVRISRHGPLISDVVSPDSDAALLLDLVLAADGMPPAYARSFPTPWDGELAVIELALGSGDPAEAFGALAAPKRTPCTAHGITIDLTLV